MMSRIDYWHWKTFSKWPSQYRTNSTLFDFNVLNWFPTSTNFYRSPFSKIWNVVEIGQCWICAVLWWPFWKWQLVEIYRCQESIRDIIIYQHIKWRWNRTMLSRIDFRHWKISIGRHFQNGHHNSAKIQHCPISSKFNMWVDNDVPNWFPNVEFLPPIFLFRVLAAILKMADILKILKTQNCSSNGDLSLCQIVCLSLPCSK
jgi:hypothetical protein